MQQVLAILICWPVNTCVPGVSVHSDRFLSAGNNVNKKRVSLNPDQVDRQSYSNKFSFFFVFF